MEGKWRGLRKGREVKGREGMEKRERVPPVITVPPDLGVLE